MSEELTRGLIEELNKIPPIMRLSVILFVIEALYKELPNAEREYNEARRQMLTRLFSLFGGEVSDND